MYDPQVGQFLSEDPIGFDGNDPNLKRMVGNNVINLIDPFGLQAEDPLKDVLDALDAATVKKPPIETKIANVGQISLTNNKGMTITTTIMEIKGGNVVIVNPNTGKPVTIPTASLSEADQVFVSQLAKVPANIIIDPKSKITAEEKSAWVKLVVAELAKLATLPKGNEILSGISAVLNPPPLTIGGTIIPQNGNTTPITIIPTSETVNGKPDSSIDIFQVNGKLDPSFPPTVKFNSGSGFAGLGKELWHAWKQIEGSIIPGGDVVEWDKDAVADVKEVLLNQATMPYMP